MDRAAVAMGARQDCDTLSLAPRTRFVSAPRHGWATRILEKVGKRFRQLTKEDWPRFHEIWKVEVIIARRLGNDAHAALLSKFKEDVKRRIADQMRRRCPLCGRHKGSGSRLCQMCYLPQRAGRRKSVASAAGPT